MKTPTEVEAAAAVRALKARRHDSVDDIAVLIGKSRTTASLKINGHQPFTLAELHDIADHYGVEFTDLFARSTLRASA